MSEWEGVGVTKTLNDTSEWEGVGMTKALNATSEPMLLLFHIR